MAKLKVPMIKIMKTFNLYCYYTVMGMCYAITGPTLLDLTLLVSTDIGTIAYIYAAKSIGCLCGSLIGGVIFDMVTRKQLFLTIGALVTTVSMFGIPWSTQMNMLIVWMVINGLSLGIMDTGTQVCCLNLWGKDGASFYQALHFCFGIGGWIAPLIAAPFLQNNTVSLKMENTTALSTNQTISPTLNSAFHNISSIVDFSVPSMVYPYSIIGGFSLFVSILFFTMSIVSPIDEDNQKQEATTSDQKRTRFTLIMVFLTCVLILTSMGTEIGYAQMLTTYSVKGPLQLTTKTGSYMTSVFWGSFTISRFSAIFLSIKFSNFTMVAFDIILTSVASLTLLFVAVHFEWALWLSSILLGFGIASYYPSSVSWLGEYITITNKIASMFAIGENIGGMLLPYIISYFIDKKPEVFIYVVNVSCATAIIVACIMYTILRKIPKKYAAKEANANAAYISDKL